MCDKYCYKINLQPIGSFFFGSEKKFNPADGGKANYLVVSRLFPQQTTLLGMIRYSLLFGLLRTNEFGDMEAVKIREHEEELIGGKSFHGEGGPYGVVERLSMLYLEKEGRLYMEAGLNRQRYDGKRVELTPREVGGGCYMEDSRLFKLEGYNPKKEWGHYLTTEQGDKLTGYDDIFQPCCQPGNQKERSGKPLKNGYYKQTRYKLKAGFSFCFYIETSKPLKPTEYRVFMGGDQSVFKVTVSPETGFPVRPADDVVEGAGVVRLLSDAYLKLEEENLKNVLFSLAEVSDFRYMKTQGGQKEYNYANLDQKSGSGEKCPAMSEKYRLAAKGSVFYCKNVRDFVAKINEAVAYQQIGYNQYLIEKWEYLC